MPELRPQPRVRIPGLADRVFARSLALGPARVPARAPTPPAGAAMWDFASSRAVAPSADVARAADAVLGSGRVARASPLPYGLGVVAVGANGSRAPQPLYFVGAAAAASRGPAVAPGWYVVATPGADFELLLTVVHDAGVQRVHGRRLAAHHGVAADIRVDGRSVSAGGYQITRARPPGSQIAVRGFREWISYAGGAAAGREQVRRFRFRRAATAAGAGAVDDAEQGCIRMEVFSGRLREANLRKGSFAPRAGKVDGRTVAERAAVKFGRSIRVASGNMDTASVLCVPKYVPRSESVTQGRVTVFLREKFWMVTQRIIDANGRPWKAQSVDEVIDVDAEEEEEEAVQDAAAEVDKGAGVGNGAGAAEAGKTSGVGDVGKSEEERRLERLGLRKTITDEMDLTAGADDDAPNGSTAPRELSPEMKKRMEERRLKRLKMQNAIRDTMDLTADGGADAKDATGKEMSESPTCVLGKKRMGTMDEDGKDPRKRNKGED